MNVLYKQTVQFQFNNNKFNNVHIINWNMDHGLWHWF